jgi:hypothetical protein
MPADSTLATDGEEPEAADLAPSTTTALESEAR